MSDESKVALTKEQIDGLQPVQAMKLMADLKLDTTGVTTLEHAKERLRLYLAPKPTPTPNKVLMDLKREYETRRSKLMEIYCDVENFLKQNKRMISQDPEVVKTLQEMQKNFLKHETLLERNECPILVSGETGAGKSSLLNLLLQKKLLPESHLSCTAVICKLRYGDTLRAIVTPKEGEAFDVPLTSDDTAFDELEPYIYQPQRRRREEWPYKEVEIFVPYDILKTGIFIVDSPGIGESSSMEQRLMDYINEEEIFAFIYVIKSDNAGGVSKDRLQRILQVLISRQESSQAPQFDPRCAIFVCNRWDKVEKEAAAVGPEEEGKVKKKIEETLATCWTGLSMSQIFYMCTTKAWDTLHATKYVTEDLGELQAGLRLLVPIGLLRKIQLSHRFLNDYCTKLLHISESFLHKASVKSTTLDETHLMARRQLSILAEKHSTVVNSLKALLEERIKEIRKNLASHLDSKALAKTAVEWEDEDLPKLQSEDTWYEFEAKALDAVQGKLAVVIFRWEKETSLLSRTQGTLIQIFEERFSELEDKLKDAQLVLEGQSSTQLPPVEAAEDAIEIDELLAFKEDFHAIMTAELSTRGRATINPILLPFIAIKDLLMSIFRKATYTIEQQQENEMKRFRKEPKRFMAGVFRRVIDIVKTSENLETFVRNRLDGASRKVAEIESQIPRALKEEANLMESLKRDTRSKSTIHSSVTPIVAFLREQLQILAKFGNMYAYTADYTEEDIVDLKNKTDDRRKALWGDYAFGRLKDSTNVCLKTINEGGHISMAKELEILRRNCVHLQTAKINHYGGLLGGFEEIPRLVFVGPTSTLRAEFNSGHKKKSLVSDRILIVQAARKKEYLEQLVTAISYIHSKGWVHMELTMDTVLLADDRVHLSNIGPPRIAPVSHLGGDAAGGHVYLAPEVIQSGALYTFPSDMYSLGILCWELWYERLAFNEERQRPLRDFAQGLTDDFLHRALVTNSKDCPFLSIIKSCVKCDSARRKKARWCTEDVRRIVVDKK